MVIKARKLESALLSKGFELRGGDHRFYWLIVDGQQTTVKTKVSHGEKELNDWLISQIRQQMFLRKSEFLDFVDCPLTKESYVALLREAGRI